MIYIALFAICTLFIELFILLRLNDTIKSVFDLSQQAVGVVTSKQLNDNEKEVIIRQTSLEMFKVTFIFIFKFVAIVLILYLAYLLLAEILSFSEATFVESLYSIKVIILLTLVAIVYLRLRNVVVQRLLSH